MSATSYLQKKLADLITGNDVYVSPTLYLALFTADPGESGSQTSEITGGSYARITLAGKMTAADATTGISTNSVVLNFPVATADWGTVAFVAIMDALSVGNMLTSGAASTPKTITSGQMFQLPAGQVRLRID